MKNIPERIWLCTGLEKGEEVKDFDELSEVTWSKDKTNDGDIPYKRAHRVNLLVVCSWIFAVVSVPIAYLLYVPYAVFKTLADGDEFRYFYRNFTDYLLIPLERYAKRKIADRSHR